jgi:hypothetical protein
MADILYLPATYQTGFVSIATAIWAYLVNNQGATLSAIATGISTSESMTFAALETLEAQHLVVKKANATGAACFWKASQFETLIVNNLAGARTWLSTHNGSSVSDLATAMSVAYGIASGLSEALQAESACRILHV